MNKGEAVERWLTENYSDIDWSLHANVMLDNHKQNYTWYVDKNHIFIETERWNSWDYPENSEGPTLIYCKTTTKFGSWISIDLSNPAAFETLAEAIKPFIIKLREYTRKAEIIS